MSYKIPIQISMLGGFRLAYEDKVLDSKMVHSKMICMLLEYLIVYRNKGVTQNELIEFLYPNDKSATPLSALKTLVHRARAVLNELCYTDGKNIILQCSGGYIWNPDIPLDVDAENFEKIITESAALDADKDTQLQLRLRAIDLYKGDFLPDAEMETWSIPIAAYYRHLYMNVVTFVLKELSEQNRYNEVITIAQKAIAIDQYEEMLYYFLVLALANTNQINAAKIQYDNMTKLFYSEFGVTPSIEFQAVYKNLQITDNGVEKNLSIIKSQLQEMGNKAGAFFCEYEFFKDIYRLEGRSATRNHKPIQVCLMNVGSRGETPLSKKSQNLAMKKLSDCIQYSLRSGDIYSRYSISQYVMLLPGATIENGEMVLNRIAKRFRSENSHSPAVITYSLQAIDAE